MYVIKTRSKRSAIWRPVAYFYDLATAESCALLLSTEDTAANLGFLYTVEQMEPGDVAKEVLA